MGSLTRRWYSHGMTKPQTFTYEEVIALLTSPSPRTVAVLLCLRTLNEATTGEVAKSLGWDKSNTGRRLEALAEDGLVELVDDSHNNGKAGRPARLWRAL